MGTFFVLLFGLIFSVALAVAASSFCLFFCTFGLVIFAVSKIGHGEGSFTVKCNGPDSKYSGADFNITIF